MTKCSDDVVQYMHEYLDGESNPEQERVLKEHLDSCGECRELFEELSEAIAFLELAEPIEAPVGFAEGVMAKLPHHPKQKKTGGVNRWLRKHPMLSAAALFLILMSAALFSSYNTNEQFSVTMQPNLIIEGDTVVVPKGEVIKGDLVVKNGDLRIEGQVDGNVTVIKGEKYMASTAVVTGNIEEIDEIFDWLWYKMKSTFKNLTPDKTEKQDTD
ncbi:zf-HC2 domain-containing protein [Sporosarcina aquimarina]|uniref:Anti-sigma-W factor RsiW n=1 Tax=Sporosarcina aquimarina TaxID=114975 RepID=A0ABU4FZ94_9BACL|nr:zf-HC2 domain-containing protein [Sporosarcina aquimarina]MDW0110037.1 zf-HC2 domain-containing protein [Sporosarcina aquimarina]